MNKCRLAGLVVALILALNFTPAISQSQSPDHVATKIESSQNTSDTEEEAKDKREQEVSKAEEEKRKEEEIRLEVEKRRKVEMERRWREWARRNIYYYSHYGGYYPSYSTDASSQTFTSTSTVTSTSTPEYKYRESEALKSYIGIVIAPGQGSRKNAVGLQYLGNRGYGFTAWIAGSFGQDDDVIPSTIPHTNYYTETRTGTYGIRAVFGVGSDAAMVFFGAGVSFDETTRIDISNVTGWRWDGGKNITARPAAMLGCRLRTSGKLSLHLGYDTLHSAFFGLSASF